MSNVFCIGNGTSRKDFNLEKLRPHGKIYGCNALYSCLLYTSPSPRDRQKSRMPSSA